MTLKCRRVTPMKWGEARFPRCVLRGRDMQFIEELTMIHRAAIGVAVVLIMVLLVVSARRRRAAAGAHAEAPESATTKTRRRDRRKELALTGRKRRKLAAEAARSMGVDSAPAAAVQVPAVPNISIPEVTGEGARLAEAPVEEILADPPTTEPVEEALHPEPVALPVADDPYLHEGDGTPGAVVAQPGWPAPGELASSFDPDAFDPLPEAYGPLKDDGLYDESAVSPSDNDDTSAIELPEFSTSGEVAALEEIEEWTDTFDAGGSWSEADDEVATESTWTISHEEPEPEVAAIAGPPALDTETIWSEPDEEPHWVADDVAAPVADVPDGAVVDEGLTFDAPDPAWADDSQAAWQADGPEASAAVPEIPAALHDAPVNEPAAPALWNGSIAGPNTPVVLDLAGLAASGQSLELVIEPSADGHGVRLRFGAPGASGAEGPVALQETLHAERLVPPDEAPETEGAVDPDDIFGPERLDAGTPVEVVEPVIDVSFLAGVAPGDEPQAPAELPEVAVASAPLEPAYVFDPPVACIADGDAVALDSTPADGDSARQAAPADATAATAVMDADDDPAKILADIRARLAALDARR